MTTKVQTGDIFNTVAMDMGNRLGLKLPQQVAVGIYYNTPKIAVGADYVYQDWRSGNSRLVEKSAAGFDVAYRNTNTVKLGVEYTPNKADVRSALKRWSYRAGVRYGTYNQTFGGVAAVFSCRCLAAFWVRRWSIWVSMSADAAVSRRSTNR